MGDSTRRNRRKRRAYLGYAKALGRSPSKRSLRAESDALDRPAGLHAKSGFAFSAFSHPTDTTRLSVPIDFDSVNTAKILNDVISGIDVAPRYKQSLGICELRAIAALVNDGSAPESHLAKYVRRRLSVRLFLEIVFCLATAHERVYAMPQAYGIRSATRFHCDAGRPDRRHERTNERPLLNAGSR
jgi:hypothetical protein